MSTAAKVRLVPCEPDLNEKLEAVYERITMRAYEKWLSRTAKRPGNRQQWVVAKNELFYKPKAEVRDWAHGVTVRLTCPDLEAKDIRVFVASGRVLVMAPMRGADDRWLFRVMNFKNPVDTADASAEYADGVLEITATYCNAPDDQKVNFKVA